ncbi:MAG: hypothetical protein N2596_08780, partial [Syntrophorhabdaceae bacterium]|nr:hypothetical protein [Syntrophorhabdaceae bacterium]
MKHKRISIVFLVFFSISLMTFQLSNLNAQDFAIMLADSFLKKTPVTEYDTSMTMDEALKVQKRFVDIISKEFGPPVGYKAGLTNPNVQKVFGVSHPVRGTLLEKMFLKNNAEIEAKFGIRSMFEGDLLVRVGNDAINDATTPEEALKNLEAVIPFIELPDLVYDP